MLFALTVCTLALPIHAADSHAGHDHSGANEFEWAGIFETPEDTYMWTAQKVDGSYADPAMKLAAIPATAADESTLHALEAEGNHALEHNCTDLHSGGTIVPGVDKCYSLKFDDSVWQTLFKVDTSNAAHKHVVFFAEHFPTEFENTAHYLKDDHGDDIEPGAEMPEAVPTPAPTPAPEKEADWGAAMGAAILVNFVTLIGVIFAIPAFAAMAKSYFYEVQGVVSGFAAGAIMACAFFLLLFESTHLIGVGWDKEVEILWRWGVMILAGFLLPGIADMVVSFVKPPEAIKDVSDPDAPKQAALSARARLLAGVLIGDFFHNLCDGFFLGAAFKGCGSAFGWTVVMGTVIHELPQEIADYLLLTGPDCGLGPIKALLCNFACGLSVIVGAIMVLSADIGDDATGLLLAFGGGTYLHIAATECMPKIYSEKLSPVLRVACIFAFILGATVIGLVLLGHEHCVPPTPEGAPAPPAGGHGHGGH